MLIECWKLRFRSAVEGFKKACREKRFAAMNLRKTTRHQLLWERHFCRKKILRLAVQGQRFWVQQGWFVAQARKLASLSSRSRVFVNDFRLCQAGATAQERGRVRQKVPFWKIKWLKCQPFASSKIRYSCWSNLQWHPARQRDLVNGLYQAS